MPSQGKTNEECQTAIEAEIKRLKEEPVSAEDLQAVKTRARADLIRSLGSNEGLASQLTFNQTIMGDWHEMFSGLEKINAVTAHDVQRVANEVFKDANRTVGTIEPAN
jgi:predicted Zn-dependent peptidase